MTLINDTVDWSRTEMEGKVHRRFPPNVEFTLLPEFDYAPVVVSKKRLVKGTELWISYGDDTFWKLILDEVTRTPLSAQLTKSEQEICDLQKRLSMTLQRIDDISKNPTPETETSSTTALSDTTDDGEILKKGDTIAVLPPHPSTYIGWLR